MAFLAGILVTLLGCAIALAEGGGAAADVRPSQLQAASDATHVPPAPAYATELPPVVQQVARVQGVCGDPKVVAALASGDDEAVVTAVGGGVAFRDAVVAGKAPCLVLNDPNRAWVLVNKHQPLNPASYEPQDLRNSSLPGTSGSLELRNAAATELEAMAQGLADAGAGRLGLNNGYRPYWLQERNYNTMSQQSGREEADRSSARPGFSEHQTGLTFDAISCSNGCGSMDGFASSPEGAWVKEHAWEYGFIVRYEEGMTDVTGYIPEPWHLRYIGRGIAQAYHDGGYRSLEDFFGTGAAPGYLD